VAFRKWGADAYVRMVNSGRIGPGRRRASRRVIARHK